VSGSNFNPRNTQSIPPVKIFAFLELEQISTDFEIEHFSKVSMMRLLHIDAGKKAMEDLL